MNSYLDLTTIAFFMLCTTFHSNFPFFRFSLFQFFIFASHSRFVNACVNSGAAFFVIYSSRHSLSVAHCIIRFLAYSSFSAAICAFYFAFGLTRRMINILFMHSCPSHVTYTPWRQLLDWNCDHMFTEFSRFRRVYEKNKNVENVMGLKAENLTNSQKS